MQILIWRPADGKYFDGKDFAATRSGAFSFVNAQKAIDLIRARKLFQSELVVAYSEDSEDFRVSGSCFELPDEVVSGLAVCRNFRRSGNGV